jgi:hypothetical protein
MGHPGIDTFTDPPPKEPTMRYLCLVYADEAALNVLPQPEVDALIDETLATNQALAESGHLVLAQALEQVEAATRAPASGASRCAR